MENAIGAVESNSIAKGIEAADAMLKAADVRVLASMPTCPGKYIVVVGGEVAAVTSSVKAGAQVLSTSLIDSFIIPNVHAQVFPAIMGTTVVPKIDALGVIETFSLASCINASDAAVKAANVTLIEVRLGRGLGGKSFVTLTGEVASVKAAVDAGISTIKSEGLILNWVVIPAPHKDLVPLLM